MPAEAVERRLAAILAADVAGYSRLIGLDEEGTLARLKALRREIIDPQIASHRGRLVKTTGDGLLVEFVSVVDAVRCAVAVQRACVESETALPQDRRIEFRIGINLGDIVVEGDDILGDGVNIAARLEGIADPGGICISGIVHDQVRGKVEVEFADLGQQNLKNIAQPVQAYRVLVDKTTTPILSRPLPLPDKPSIAVLPFQNISGDPEQEYFADGVVEEIITALSRIRWLFVIARNSSFTYKGKLIDVKQVGHELGVRYVLEGSVRKAGQRVRITAQLIDATNGAHLWAERFDGSIEDIFELQDNVAMNAAGVIGPALEAVEIRRSTDWPTDDLAAYDLYLRALAPNRSGEFEKGRYLQSLSLLDKAIALDPRYGRALVFAAVCHHALHVAGWTDDADAERREGTDLARRALTVAGNDPEVLGNVARVLGYFGEDLSAAITLMNRALELNPSFAQGWQWSGWLQLWAGHPDVGIHHFETSLRLNPLQGRADHYAGVGIGHFFAKRFDQAAESLLLSIQEAPKWVPPYRFLASSYAHLGRLDAARQTIVRLRVLTSDVVPTAAHWRNPEHRGLYLDGLRLAARDAI